MKLSEELEWRGFVAQHTFGNITDLDTKTHKFYFGADPTADSLTIGNLAAIMMVKCFQRHGYEPYLLVGGATGMIGDPKDTEERQLETIEEIDHNKKAIHTQMARIVGANIKMVDNYEWFRDIKLIPFLREIGKQFSMTQLLDRDFVKSRIGEGKSGVSFAEFSYSLIQGYDFLHLFRTYGVDLQLCGADQWGNSVSGMHLIKRLEGAEANVWSTPLVVDPASGRKFGKSEGNAVWLSEEKTSAYAFYQFWLNTNDESLEYFLKFYTELDRPAVEQILSDHAKNPGARLAQAALAYEVTKIVHGAEKADAAAKVTKVLFGGESFDTLSEDDKQLLVGEIATVERGGSLVGALVTAGLAKSNGDARQLIVSGAVSINGQKTTEDTTISESCLIKKGKNNFILVR